MKALSLLRREVDVLLGVLAGVLLAPTIKNWAQSLLGSVAGSYTSILSDCAVALVALMVLKSWPGAAVAFASVFLVQAVQTGMESFK